MGVLHILCTKILDMMRVALCKGLAVTLLINELGNKEQIKNKQGCFYMPLASLGMSRPESPFLHMHDDQKYRINLIY
jgi:hypothetical protein